jgi:hypothetical protein
MMWLTSSEHSHEEQGSRKVPEERHKPGFQKIEDAAATVEEGND